MTGGVKDPGHPLTSPMPFQPGLRFRMAGAFFLVLSLNQRAGTKRAVLCSLTPRWPQNGHGHMAQRWPLDELKSVDHRN
jgi:hypothetical protein